MANSNVQEPGPVNNSGSVPKQDDDPKSDKGLETTTSSCSGTDASCGSDVGTVDKTKIDKGI